MKLELRQLRYFVAVAEELNFTRAAERVFLSQPALSHQVRGLEETLGVKLLLRTSRRVELTDAGRDLLKLAKETLTNLEHGVAELRQKAGLERVRFRIGFTEYANYSSIPRIIERFREAHPDVLLEHQEGSTLEQLTALREGRLDAGFFLANMDENDEQLGAETLWSEPFVLALPEAHPLAANERVPMRALAGERLIVNSRTISPGTHDYILELCRRAGFEPELVVNEGPHIYTFSSMARLVASGVGVFLVVKTLSQIGFPGVVFRPLVDPEPAMDIVLSWRRGDESAYLKTLRALTRQEFKIDFYRE